MKTSYAEIKFSAVAVQKGFVTANQVVKAMSIQVSEDLMNGKYRPIESILLDEKLITSVQAEEVRRSMNEIIRENSVL